MAASVQQQRQRQARRPVMSMPGLADVRDAAAVGACGGLEILEMTSRANPPNYISDLHDIKSTTNSSPATTSRWSARSASACSRVKVSVMLECDATDDASVSELRRR